VVTAVVLKEPVPEKADRVRARGPDGLTPALSVVYRLVKLLDERTRGAS